MYSLFNSIFFSLPIHVLYCRYDHGPEQWESPQLKFYLFCTNSRVYGTVFKAFLKAATQQLLYLLCLRRKTIHISDSINLYLYPPTQTFNFLRYLSGLLATYAHLLIYPTLSLPYMTSLLLNLLSFHHLHRWHYRQHYFKVMQLLLEHLKGPFIDIFLLSFILNNFLHLQYGPLSL